MNTINPENLPQIVWQNQNVITTELLAQCYETDIANIRKNHSRNPDRFAEGIHYFKLEGEQLKAFKHRVTNSHSVDAKNDDLADQLETMFKNSGPNAGVMFLRSEEHNRVDNIDSVDIGARTKSLMLWTEKGAVRHAKILDTDKAWEVQERLEEVYFHPERKTGGVSQQSFINLQERLLHAQHQVIGLMEEKVSNLEIRVPANTNLMKLQPRCAVVRKASAIPILPSC